MQKGNVTQKKTTVKMAGTNVYISNPATKGKRRYNWDASFWEALNNLQNVENITDYFIKGQWPISGLVSGEEYDHQSTIPKAPLGHRNMFDLTLVRILSKHIDDAADNIAHKLRAYFYAFRILNWVITQRAEGRAERPIKHILRKKHNNNKNLREWVHELNRLNNINYDWGRRNLTDERDDVEYNIRKYKNTEGNIAPALVSKLSKDETNKQTKKMIDNKGYYPPRRSNINFGFPNYNSMGNYPNTNSYNNNPFYGNYPNKRFMSAYSKRKDKPSAPILKSFYNPDKFSTQWSPNVLLPKDYCEAWQTDNCFNKDCNLFHACKWCGKKHPSSHCVFKPE